MIKELKQESYVSYTIIALMFVSMFISTSVFINSQKSSANILNTAAKQRMYSQRIALLLHEYHDSSFNNAYKNKILDYVDQMKNDNMTIREIKNIHIDQVLYGSGYDFNNLLKEYLANIELFISTKDLKYLKIVNFLNESVLNTSDTIVSILENDYKKFIGNFQLYLLVLLIIGMIALVIIYKKVTLKSILNAQEFYDKLTKSQEDLLQTQTIAKSISWVMDIASENISLSDQSINILGIKDDSKFTLDKLCDIVYGEDLSKLLELFDDAINFGVPFQTEFRVETDNKLKVFEIYCDVKSENDDVTELYGLIQDITYRAKIRDDMKLYVDSIDKNIITSTTDKSGVITYVSDAFCKISGYKKEELIGQKHSILRHPDMPKELYIDLWSTISSGNVWRGEIKNLKKDGGYYWVDVFISPRFDYKGNIIGYTAIRQDITDKKQVEYLSITDGLTNLYNRRYFNDISQKELDRARREKGIFAFIMLDVDNFKKYNDVYGHQMGDDALVDISKVLQESFQRANDIVFRLGGEEFGIIINSDSIDKIEIIVEKARENIENLNIEHKENLPSKVLTASFGVIVDNMIEEPEKYNIDEIYKLADDMLYEAKESGRNRVCIKEIK